MKRELTTAEIEQRFKKINSRKPETLTDDEAASLTKAESINDGTTVRMDEFMQELKGYSGRLVLRIPSSLHKALKEQAAAEGVSLNQYMLYKLSR